MRQLTVVGLRATAALLVCGAVLAALPASAELYTIKLSNGTTFESRYQPKQAPWDKTLITFLDETGTEIALPQNLVTEVISDSEAKGYGRMINTTTIDLGYAPNDIDQVRQMVADQRAMFGVDEQQEAYYKQTNSQQFVEPDQLGGTPIWGVGYGGGAVASPYNAPVPQLGVQQNAPSPGMTPAPFTTPSPAQTMPAGAAAPPTSPQ
jgi:hypothetical protein